MKPLLLLLLSFHLPLSTPMRFNFRHPSPTIDPYATLSIPPTASPSQIQKAYRAKARETHPDKNSSPTANEEFRLISEAFDILSDPQKKYVYDERIKREERMREEQRRRDEMQRRAQERQRQEQMRLKQEMVRRARTGYDRVLKWSNLSQLEEMAIGKKNVYTKNVLIMFVGNKAAEKRGEEDYYFPYPFVGESGSSMNNDVLLVAKVRYNSPTPLTRLFRAPTKSDNPYFIFAKKGDQLHHYYIYHPKRHQLDHHEDFKHWVQSLLQIRGIIVNRHSLPITIFILRDERIEYMHDTLQPSFEIELNFHPGDRILAFDARLDSYPGGRRYNNEKIIRNAESIAILDTVVTSKMEYVVPNKRCYDLSTQCYEWAMVSRGQMSQCVRNPEFMHHICPYTCKVCDDGMLSDLKYAVFHYPLHRMPSMFQGIVDFFRYFLGDLKDILESRRNAAAMLMVLGLVVAFNIVFFQTSHVTKYGDEGSMSVDMFEVWLLVEMISLCIVFKIFMSIPNKWAPEALKRFHIDVNQVGDQSDVVLALLIAGIVISIYVKTLVTFISSEDVNNSDIAYFAAVVVASVAVYLWFTLGVLGNNTATAIRWSHLWNYRKNAAFAFSLVGALVGTGLMAVTRLVTPLLNVENLSILVTSNMFVMAGMVYLSTLDPHFYSDVVHIVSTNISAVFALIFVGVSGGLVYMKVIDMLTEEEVHKEPEKVKID